MAEPDSLTIVLLAPASSVHTRRWASALTRAGHHIVVASWMPGPRLAGVDVRIAPAVGARPARRVPLAAIWLRRLIADTRPDVVHVHSLGMHGLLSLALPPGPARVVTPWGGDLRAAHGSPARSALVRLALGRADLALPTSKAAAAEMISRYAISAARVQVLSWGVDETLITASAAISAVPVRAAYGIPADATVALSVRSVSPTYRTCEIVSAFTQALAVRPGLFLVVLTGHRPDPDPARTAQESYLRQVRKLARAAGPRVLIVERPLTPGQAFELMRASDFAVSVPNGDQRSSSVLEAGFAGCRLLLSDIAPYREMIADGLAADLLAEPIIGALADRLSTATVEASSQHRNWRFVHAQEHGSDKVEVLERIYRQLAARH
jgi:glycosyltransferase involved in cell wall biosynthesis